MNYFCYEEDVEYAIEIWEKSQFDLCDVVLSLTDRRIIWGLKIYYVFSRKEVLKLMTTFTCDFIKIKEELGVIGEYVERKENPYSKTFNPKRNINALAINKKTMEERAKAVYKQIMSDLAEIAFILKQ